MNKVYIPQEPARYDTAENRWVSTVDLTPAAEYGEIVICSAHRSNFINASQLTKEITDALRDSEVEDYIVPVGDPVAISIAVAFVSKRNGGRVKLLKWDRKLRKYYGVSIHV